MRTCDFFAKGPVFSIEVFPPKPDAPIDTIYKTLDGMKDIRPDFISVTYGAGGGSSSNKTFQIASDIKNKYNIESVAHLTCIGLTRENITTKLAELRNLGIENILALRGDLPKGSDSIGDWHHASDLITYIRDFGGFNILAACYPEGHIESSNLCEDTDNLRRKVDCGVSHLMSQLFFDNDYFYDFLDRCHKAGISVPIEAGIMPVVNQKQIKRMATLCGATVPRKFARMMDRYGDNPIAMRDCGIAYAIDQIVDLEAHGVDGIHLYTMNNPYIANKIYESVSSIVR